MNRRPQAVFVAAFDSQLKWCARLRSELVSRGFEARVVAPAQKWALSSRQITDAGFESIEPLAWDDLVAACDAADVAVISLAGPTLRELTLDLAARQAPGSTPPVLVGGWVGVIIEKITAGYLDRSGLDVVAVNAAHELAHFREVAHELDIPTDNLVLSGLPILSADPRPQRTGPVRTVLFADQPTVPGAAVDRLYVYRRLIDYARRHPERTVLLKPRHQVGEDTFHRMHHHPEELLAGESVPPNFRIDHRPIVGLLDEVDLLLTMSSTACLEAVDHGCRVALVLDLGVHERYGNHVFLDSGLLRTFDQIEADDLGTPRPEWVESWFGGRTGDPAAVVADRVEKLLATGERPSQVVLDSAYQRGAAALHLARREGRVPAAPSPWSRRCRKHGYVLGTALQLGDWFTPPVLLRPLRRWWGRRTFARS